MNKPPFNVLYVLVIVLFLLPIGLRLLQNNSLPPGDEPYYYLRLAQELREKGFFEIDPAAYNGRLVFWTPVHLLLASVLFVAHWKLALIMLPFLLMLGTVALLIMFLRNEKLSPWVVFATTLVFILSPITLYLATHYVPATLALFLLLLGTVALQRKWIFFAAIIFGVNATIGIVPALASMAFLWGYAKVKRVDVRTPWLLVLLVFLVVQLSRLGKISFAIPSFVRLGGLTTMLSDVGGLVGFSTFAVLLAILGLVIIWRHKAQYYPVYILLLLALGITMFFHPLLPYVNLLIAVLAGIALTKLFLMRWKLASIQYLTLLVLVCGLLFSSIGHIALQVKEQPTQELVAGLSWLQNNAPEQARVFSHPSKGHWITFFAQRRVLMDDAWEGTHNADHLYAITTALFSSYDLQVTAKYLRSQNIRYIVITPDFYQGLVWQKPEHGLHFLLLNSESFKKRFSGKSIEVWEYLPQDEDAIHPLGN